MILKSQSKVENTISVGFNSNTAWAFYFDFIQFCFSNMEVLITDLEYEATHSGAGRQHQENVREEHEVTLTLLLINTSSINSLNSHTFFSHKP